MKKIILTMTTTAALLTTSYPAFADYGDPNSFINDVNNNTGPNGWLLSFNSGTTYTPEQKFTDKTLGGWSKVKYSWGWNSNFSLGYKYMNWRLEGTGGYLRNKANKLTDNPSIKATNISGNTNAWTYMLNLYFDFNTNSTLVPFIGVGGGGASIHYNNIKGNGLTTKIDERNNVLAYQGIIGMGYQITPNWRIAGSYHYFRTQQATFNTTVHHNGVATNEDIKTTYQSNFANLGVTYFFG